jgi:hypothetical protein
VKREIESLLGRPLKVSEDLNVRLEGRDMIEIRDRLRSSGWVPALVSNETNVLDDEIARVENEIKQEKLAQMTPKERELWMLKETKRQEIDKANRDRMDAAERAARQPVLSKLQALYDEYADNPFFTDEHLEAVTMAIIAVETPGSDIDAAQQLIVAAQAPKAQYVTEIRGRLQQQISELTHELVEFEQTHEVETQAQHGDRPWLMDPRFEIITSQTINPEAVRQQNLSIVAEYRQQV